MATTVYLLCTFTSALCVVLLLREYRRTSARLLFWSGLSFTGNVCLLRLGAFCLILYGIVQKNRR